MRSIAEITKKMIAFSEGNLHDINHFLKVWAFARTIGISEGLDEEAQFILEVSALIHDIACPLCRKKYGCTDGKLQEKEGAPLAAEFLADARLTAGEIEKVSYIVGHHHTYSNVESIEHQILLEADYLVNADESGYSRRNIENFRDLVFRTRTGNELLGSVYGV